MIEVLNISEVLGINTEELNRIQKVELRVNKPTLLILKTLRKFSCLYDVLKDYITTILYVKNGKISQKIKLGNGKILTIRASRDQTAMSLPLNFRSLGDITHVELETEVKFDDHIINPYRNGERSSMFKNVYDFVPIKIVDELINTYGLEHVISIN